MSLHRLLLALSFVVSATLHAQAAPSVQSATPADDRAAVLAVVKALFDGMRKGDSAAVRAVFHPQVQLTTMVTQNGVPVVQVGSLDKFLGAVGAPHDAVWDERTYDEEVRIDGTLAQVWTKYDFFAGDKFSHCGVDAFTLARTTEGWRIVALGDTRRRTGCRGNATTGNAPATR